MNVLLVGSGGREHTIAKKIKESPKLKNFYAVPGNPGIAQLAEIISDKINLTEIINFCKNNKVDLIVCGPEQPLVDGLADMAKEANIAVFGPGKSGAILEGSKIYAKKFMSKYDIPTAEYKIFTEYEKAKEYIEKSLIYPMVIKADGLAAGKGVKIAYDRETALDIIHKYFIDKILGDAGTSIVIEEFMTGEEMSFLYITDGKYFLPLLPAKDYKRAFDNDKGENTGGMGAYCPHSRINDELFNLIEREIIDKVKIGFKKENIDYRGVLYVGLMLTDEGPKVVEFNCRFGDPETQVILLLIEGDLLEIMYKTATKRLENVSLKWKNQYIACVVIAKEGYPGEYKKGDIIKFKGNPYDFIHAGTKIDDNGNIVVNGGRVLNAVSMGASKISAIENAYALCNKVEFNGAFYRKDIGK